MRYIHSNFSMSTDPQEFKQSWVAFVGLPHEEKRGLVLDTLSRLQAYDPLLAEIYAYVNSGMSVAEEELQEIYEAVMKSLFRQNVEEVGRIKARLESVRAALETKREKERLEKAKEEQEADKLLEGDIY